MSCLPSGCRFDSPALSYSAQGQGETVLLLHGSASSGAMWRRPAATLQPLYRVIAPDLIGYGKSAPWPAGAPYSVESETRALAALLPCCGEAFHLVGHSFGGTVALRLALGNPVRIRTLTLIEPVFFGALRMAGADDAYSRFAAVRRRFESSLKAGTREDALRDFVAFWNGEGAWDALSKPAQAAMCAMADKIALDWKGSFALDASREQLALLADRTALVRGDQSPTAMQVLVNSLHGLMPGSSCTVLPNAGHLSPLTHGGEVTNLILAHFHADAERRLR